MAKRRDRFLDRCRPGDRVEVKKLGAEGVVWEPATLEFIDDGRVVATLADGVRMAIRRSGLDVRAPRG
jgi:hypothetical protein